MFLIPVDPPAKMKAAIERQRALLSGRIGPEPDEPPELEQYPEARAVLRVISLMERAEAAVHRLTGKVLWVMAWLCVGAVVIAGGVRVGELLLRPVWGASPDVFAACVDVPGLSQEHRLLFAAAAVVSPSTGRVMVTADTCRLMVPAARGMVTQMPIHSAGKDSFSNPRTMRDALDRSYPQ